MADILCWEKRKTRKPHRCWGCGKLYPEKSELTYESCADSGSVFSCYWCDTCLEYIERHRDDFDEECGYKEIWDNDSDGWNEINQDLHPDTSIEE